VTYAKSMQDSANVKVMVINYSRIIQVVIIVLWADGCDSWVRRVVMLPIDVHEPIFMSAYLSSSHLKSSLHGHKWFSGIKALESEQLANLFYTELQENWEGIFDYTAHFLVEDGGKSIIFLQRKSDVVAVDVGME
jgi:hypothetical protein